MKSKWSITVLGTIAAMGLQACASFQPLYGTNGLEQSQVVSDLSDIHIPPAKERVGQLIRNNLISTMSPPGQEGSGRYQLIIQPASNDFDVTVERNTDVSRRSYRLKVQYALRDSQSGQRIYTGKTFSEVNYDKVTSEFTNLQARNNARERAALEVSRDIRIRLSAFFASRGNS
ncbi:MAG: LPS assembly lipoprotein LptE [Pseudomonadota bacterium]